MARQLTAASTTTAIGMTMVHRMAWT